MNFTIIIDWRCCGFYENLSKTLLSIVRNCQKHMMKTQLHGQNLKLIMTLIITLVITLMTSNNRMVYFNWIDKISNLIEKILHGSFILSFLPILNISSQSHRNRVTKWKEHIAIGDKNWFGRSIATVGITRFNRSNSLWSHQSTWSAISSLFPSGWWSTFPN